MTPQIKCPQCEGRGTVDIGDAMSATLAVVPVNRPVTAEEVHSSLRENIGVTAVSNRLVYLYKLGLVDRKRDGKFLLYTRTPKKKSK